MYSVRGITDSEVTVLDSDHHYSFQMRKETTIASQCPWIQSCRHRSYKREHWKSGDKSPVTGHGSPHNRTASRLCSWDTNIPLSVSPLRHLPWKRPL